MLLNIAQIALLTTSLPNPISTRNAIIRTKFYPYITHDIQQSKHLPIPRQLEEDEIEEELTQDLTPKKSRKKSKYEQHSN